MKKFITILVFPLFLFAACGSGSDSTVPEKHAADKTSTPVNFEGTWLTHNDQEDSNFKVVVTPGQIKVDWVNEEEGSSALFWLGDWPAEVTSNKILSNGDVEVMERSMLASSETTKPFKYEDGELLFEMSIMGVTTTEHAKKEK